jgi:hypothetical protein
MLLLLPLLLLLLPSPIIIIVAAVASLVPVESPRKYENAPNKAQLCRAGNGPLPHPSTSPVVHPDIAPFHLSSVCRILLTKQLEAAYRPPNKAKVLAEDQPSVRDGLKEPFMWFLSQYPAVCVCIIVIGERRKRGSKREGGERGVGVGV